MFYTQLLLAFMSTAQPKHSLRTDVVQTVEGPIAVTATLMPQARRAKNWWDRRPAARPFARDEGADGTYPLVDLRKGGL